MGRPLPSHMKRWWIIIVVLFLFTGCDAATTGKVTDGLPQASVDITKHSYDPIVLYTEVGTEVTWTNKDSSPHTVTILGIFDSGVLGRRHSFSYTFTEPGTYTYTDLFEKGSRVGKVIIR